MCNLKPTNYQKALRADLARPATYPYLVEDDEIGFLDLLLPLLDDGDGVVEPGRRRRSLTRRYRCGRPQPFKPH